MRQTVVTKALKKHGLATDNIKNLPSSIANPIFVFKSNNESVSVLTELKGNDGNNLFVAIELGIERQMGHRFLEVNDILTIHGREAKNIIEPIVENNRIDSGMRTKKKHIVGCPQFKQMNRQSPMTCLILPQR